MGNVGAPARVCRLCVSEEKRKACAASVAALAFSASADRGAFHTAGSAILPSLDGV